VASHARRFLVNARKAMVASIRGVIGAIATTVPNAGRAKIASTMRHARAANHEVTAPIDARRAAPGHGRHGKIASTAPRARAGNRAGTGLIASQLALALARPEKIASAARRAKAANLAANVSAARIGQAVRVVDGHRASAIGRARHATGSVHAASIDPRAIAPKRARGMEKDSGRHAIGTATDRGRRAARGRPVGRGHPAGPGSGLKLATVQIARAVAALDVGRAHGRKAARSARRVGRARHGTTTVRRASGATTIRSGERSEAPFAARR
jgi:hypothetical protein